MFSRIAPRYDRINSLISLGLDRLWRRALLRRLPPVVAPRRVLDLCCGTGAMLAGLCRVYPAAEITGVDFAPGMLERAQTRFSRVTGGRPLLLQADQHRLPFPDGSFGLVTNAFGLRNAVNQEQALAETARVLAPGGAAAFLELTRPSTGVCGRLFSLYFSRLVPPLARCLGGDPAAYTYLPASVHGYLEPEAFRAAIAAAIGGEASAYHLCGQVVTLVVARKPYT